MAVKLPASTFIRFPSASFMDDASSLSFAFWGLLTTAVTTDKQYFFSHRGSGGQFSLRKDTVSPFRLKWSVTNPETFKIAESALVPSAGVKYHLAGTWVPSGTMRLWVDGVEDASTSTSGQTSNYNSTGATDGLIFGARTATGGDSGKCEIEGFMAWRNHELTLDEVVALKETGAWYLAGLPTPTVWYPLSGDLLTRFPDRSGNDRHITTITGSPSKGAELGFYVDPSFPYSVGSRFSATAPPPPPEPNPFLLHATVPHPQTSFNVDGLQNNVTYEFQLVAVDKTGNNSPPSASVEATPSVPAPPVSVLNVPWRRTLRFSKFKASQQ